MKKKSSSKISIGSANFGLNYTVDKIKLKKDEVFKILDLAKKSNIHSIDTAQSYGKSENTIGEYIKLNFYKKLEITTKIKIKKSKIDKILNDSQKKLSVMPRNVLVHNSEDYLNDKFREDLIEFQKRKKIMIGVSVYDDDEILKVLKKHTPDIIQLPLNAINNQPHSSGLLRLLKEQKIIIQARSVFFQGLFFKKESMIKRKSILLYKSLIKLKQIANNNNLTLPELSLIFVNSISEINKIVIGVNSANELKNNINIVKKIASKKLINEIMDINCKKINFTKIIQNLN